MSLYNIQPLLHKHRGCFCIAFSLMELMAIITIMTILSLIIVPTYTNYLNRSKISEAISLADGIKRGFIEYYETRGDFTNFVKGFANTDTNLAKLGLVDISQSSDIVYEVLIDTADKTTTTDDIAVMLLCMNNSQLGLLSTDEPAGLYFVSTPGDSSGVLKWLCYSNGQHTELLPSECRSEISSTDESTNEVTTVIPGMPLLSCSTPQV